MENIPVLVMADTQQISNEVGMKMPLGELWMGARPWVLALLTVLCLLGTATISIWSVYHSAVHHTEISMKQSLLQCVKSIALWIDVEQHKRFLSPEQESSAEYIQAIAQLQRAKDAVEIYENFKFVYTCVLDDQGKVRFVLDPTPAGDSDGDGVDDKAHINEVYAEANPYLIEVLKTGAAATNRYPVADRWGTFLSGYAPFYDAHGRVAGVVGLDMELKVYEKQIAEMRRLSFLGFCLSATLSCFAGLAVWLYQSRLQASLREVWRSMQLARAGDQAKSDFLATMSHEIRTPMNGVIGMSYLLSTTQLSEEQQEYVEAITVSGNALMSIINDILDFSKIESGALHLENVRINLARLLHDWQSVFSPQFAEKGLTFAITQTDDCPAEFWGDPTRVGQVMMNLLSNAKKFTHEGGVTLELSLEQTADHRAAVHFAVRDTGIGIEADKLQHIFKVFAQADSSTTRRYGGSGLGLAICERLTQCMGGRIWAESQIGVGSTFHVVLPVGDGD